MGREDFRECGGRFKRKVKPGDTLTLKVTLDRLRSSSGTGMAEAYVGEQLACKCEILFAFS